MFEVYQPRVFADFISIPKDMCPSLHIIPIIVDDEIKGLRIFFGFVWILPKRCGCNNFECVMFDASL